MHRADEFRLGARPSAEHSSCHLFPAVIDTIPMHALGTPDDVAEAVRYLVSDEAHYLTGALVPVAGGLLMM